MPYPRIIHVFDVRLYGSTDSFSSAMDPLFHCRPGFPHPLPIQITTCSLSPPTALAFTPLILFSPTTNSSLFLSRFLYVDLPLSNPLIPQLPQLFALISYSHVPIHLMHSIPF